MVVGNNESTTMKNAGKSLAISIAMQMRWYDVGAHHPMEHIQDFIQSHWMPPKGECLRPIAPAAATVNEFVETTQNTKNKTLTKHNI
jgi:hypothetical protein